MDLIDWRAAVKVTVNGEDVASGFSQRLMSLTITDTAGVQSDTLDIVLSDSDPLARLALPATGAEISVALGYGYLAQPIGIYVVEEIEVSGPPDSVSIRAYASSYGETDEGRSAINDQKTRSWPENTTIAAMVGKIAGESGFEAAVSAEAGKIQLPHQDQIDESDIALLSRVARDNGAIFKPGGGKLVMVKSGESTSAAGEPLPVVQLGPKQISTWRMAVRRPEVSKQVVTKYRDLEAAETIEVTATTTPATSVADASQAGKDILSGKSSTSKIKRTYPSRAAAETAAKAAAQDAQRKSYQLSLRLPGRADLMAEGRVLLQGVRPGVDREWLIRQVTHQVDPGSGWSCSVEAEMPPGT